MKLLGITCRVNEENAYTERRDGLDQNWFVFLEQAGYLPVVLPNRVSVSEGLLEHVELAGMVLTGGNSPVLYQGNAPERDDLDRFLIQYAQKKKLPVLGVCRGMQSIQLVFGQPLVSVTQQIKTQQDILIRGELSKVNAYHHWGAFQSVPDLEVWARGLDGIVKAVKHTDQPLWGIMWHPERMNPFRSEDILLFQEIFL